MMCVLFHASTCTCISVLFFHLRKARYSTFKAFYLLSMTPPPPVLDNTHVVLGYSTTFYAQADYDQNS